MDQLSAPARIEEDRGEKDHSKYTTQNEEPMNREDASSGADLDNPRDQSTKAQKKQRTTIESPQIHPVVGMSS